MVYSLSVAKKKRGRTHIQRIRKVEDRVIELAAMVGMSDWKVTIDEDPCDDGFAAQCLIFSHNEAIISLASDWHTMSKKEQDITLLHELFHCHADRLKSGYVEITKAVVSTIPKKTRDRVRKLIKPVINEANKLEEQWVEHMARSFLEIN